MALGFGTHCPIRKGNERNSKKGIFRCGILLALLLSQPHLLMVNTICIQGQYGTNQFGEYFEALVRLVFCDNFSCLWERMRTVRIARCRRIFKQLYFADFKLSFIRNDRGPFKLDAPNRVCMCVYLCSYTNGYLVTVCTVSTWKRKFANFRHLQYSSWDSVFRCPHPVSDKR